MRNKKVKINEEVSDRKLPLFCPHFLNKFHIIYCIFGFDMVKLTHHTNLISVLVRIVTKRTFLLFGKNVGSIFVCFVHFGLSADKFVW